ncbi:hypothetical protein BB560_000753, partial [Smittium megazygosporum]
QTIYLPVLLFFNFTPRKLQIAGLKGYTDQHTIFDPTTAFLALLKHTKYKSSANQQSHLCRIMLHAHSTQNNPSFCYQGYFVGIIEIKSVLKMKRLPWYAKKGSKFVPP